MVKAEATVEELVSKIERGKLLAGSETSGDLFLWESNDALDFQGQLEAYGAISGRRKLPWRYRWRDAVRDDVLARLLALNAERYAEEVAQGLHNKGSSKASGAAAAAGKRRGRPAKTSDSADTEQIGLAL